MTDLWGAVFLGAVQGFTEFAPVSSTAHLILVPWLLGWQSPLLNSLTFDVALHMGTLGATLSYFYREWVLLGKGAILRLVGRRAEADPWSRLAWLLAVATVPGVFAGVLLEAAAERALRAPALVAVAMILMGLALAAAERWGAKAKDLDHISPLVALAIGVGQAVAIIPGVSRSGGTMTAALLLGVQREAAARFSFLLATPIVAGAGLKKLGDMAALGLSATEAPVLLAGFVASAAVGYLSIKYLLRYLQQGTLYVFVWYRLALGGLVLLVVRLGGGG